MNTLKKLENQGLQSKDISALRAQFGYNEIPMKDSGRAGIIFRRQWDSPLIWLLILAIGLCLWLRDFNEALAISLIVIINIAVGFFQEWKAENTLRSLRSTVALEAKVFRDGLLQVLPARELLPGDMVFLEAGDRVPADGLVFEQYQVAMDESILTGESFPVESLESVKMGTHLVRGTLKFKVKEIGAQSEFGQTAEKLSVEKSEVTPLQMRLSRLSKQIMFFCSFVALMIMFLNLYQGRPLLEVLIFSISLLVASVPEGMPVMVSLGLSFGVIKMARRKVLVRRLAAVETLGNVTRICTDKTGTLTFGQLELIEIESQNIQECLTAALSCIDASIKVGEGVGDPLEKAIARRALKELHKQREDIDLENPRLSVVPFDSETRSMKITRADQWTYWKGASEVLWDSLSQELKNQWNEKNQKWTQQGYRTLGVAKIDPNQKINFLGLLVFQDPPRPEVVDAIKAAQTAGIQTIMLTGDNEQTAQAIAKQLGIKEFWGRLKSGKKLTKISTLQDQGEIVAMTGDGVNDAPALKEAHVGVSMGLRGSEVAREASDIVLLDDNYASLVAAIKEGRGIFLNIRKSLVYLLMGNWAELCLIGLSSLFSYPLPLIASQLLWINLLTDGVPALVLMLEPASDSIMKLKPRPLAEGLLRSRDWFKVLLYGTIEGTIVFWVFKESLQDHNLQVAQTLAFFTLVWSQVLRLLVFSQSLNFWKGLHKNSARVILGCVFLSILFQSLFVCFESTRAFLSLSIINGGHWLLIARASAITSVMYFLIEKIREINLFKK